MKNIIIYNAIAICVILFLYYAAKWKMKKSSDRNNEKLRNEGRALLAQNSKLSEREAAAHLVSLIQDGSIRVIAAGGEMAPIPVRLLPGSAKELLVKYKTIEMPVSSVIIGWQWIDGKNSEGESQSLRIGKSVDSASDVCIDKENGMITDGNEKFVSLAHYLVFVAE